MSWVRNMSEPDILAATPAPDIAVVSIADSEPPRTVNVPDGYSAVLSIQFNDVPAGQPGDMTPDQAETIAAFLLRHRFRRDNILVHCGAGISRSGAVVDVVLRAFPEYQDRGANRNPNPHVMALMEEALGL